MQKKIKQLYWLTVFVLSSRLRKQVSIKAFTELCKYICKPLESPDVVFTSPTSSELVVLNIHSKEVYMALNYNKGKPIAWLNKYMTEPEVKLAFIKVKRYIKSTNNLYIIYRDNAPVRYHTKMEYLHTLVSDQRVVN